MGLRMKERSVGVADDRMIERVLLLQWHLAIPDLTLPDPPLSRMKFPEF